MNPIFQLHSISYTYPTGSIALDDINLTIPRNGKIALLGGNGAGKTSLLLHLNGILKPSSGKVIFKNSELRYTRKPLKNIRKEVGLLFYESDHQLFAPTVFEEISLGLANYSKDKDEIRRKVYSVLDDFSLYKLKDHIPHRLSSGQKKLVALAAVMALEPSVLICDEPCAGLDPVHSDMIYDRFETLHRNGTTIIISTHNVEKAYQWADYVLIMDKGKILAAGNTNDVFDRKDIFEQAHLKMPIIVELLQKMSISDVQSQVRSVDDIFRLLQKNENCV